MLREMLRGFEAGRPQMAGNMTVVPLAAQGAGFPALGGVAEVVLAEDRAYDTLVLSCRRSEVAVVPQGLVFITKEHAQDRTVPAAHLLQAKPKAVRAFCVQSSQGGLMQREREAERELRLLPARLRLAALAKRGEQGYNHLWQELAAYNEQVGVRGDFLVSFLREHARRLAEFVAEFEPLPGQRGAVVLIDGEVAGIEVLPTEQAFLDVWELLIRDCYGAEALARGAEGEPAAPVDLALADVESLDALLPAVEDAERRELAWARRAVDAVLEQDAAVERDQRAHGFVLEYVLADGLEGQRVQRDGETAWLSLLRTRPARRAFRWS